MPKAWAPLIPFATWAPDLTPQNTSISANIINVIPRADGYGPHPSLLSFTSTLPGPCRGAFQARNSDGSVTIFGATNTNLYMLNNTTFAWTLVSQGGGPYLGLPTTDNWQFAQFNTLVIAVQQNVAPQVWTLGSSSAFATLGGSPPQAGHIAIVNRFIVLSGLLSNYSRVQWCDLDNPTQWTAGVGLADFQDLPDGGLVHDVRGGDLMGIIFQDTALRWLIFSPGSAFVFDISRISLSDGILGQYSSVTAGDNIFFYSPQGFKVIAPGGYPQQIGKESVDRTFAALLDQTNLQLFQAATDPNSTRVYWAFKSTAGSTGQWDTIFMYDWSLQKWATLSVSGQFLTYLAKPGITLEGIDAIAPGVISITAASSGTSGRIRLTLSGLTAGTPGYPPPNSAPTDGAPGGGNTNLNVENTVEIYNATGGVPAGNFRFNIIDSTHIDLIGTTFTSTGTGSIGGALDQLPFSLDSIANDPLPALAAFNTSGAAGFFNGPNLQATLDTPEQNAQGRRFFVSSIRPKTDCTTALGYVGWRDNMQTAVAYVGGAQVNGVGETPVRIDGRYLRYRAVMPAGATWTVATGIEPLQSETGTR